jgi:hypothetical protein
MILETAQSHHYLIAFAAVLPSVVMLGVTWAVVRLTREAP